MKKFLVLYMANQQDFEKMMKSSTPEQQKKGMDAWMKWIGDHKASLVDSGAPLGKTKRVNSKGASDTKNGLGGYSIVQAELGRRGDQDFRQGPPAPANARRLDRSHRYRADSGDVEASSELRRKGRSRRATPFLVERLNGVPDRHLPTDPERRFRNRPGRGGLGRDRDNAARGGTRKGSTRARSLRPG